MMPAQEDDTDLVNWRINSWKNRIAPEGYAFPGIQEIGNKKSTKQLSFQNLEKKY